MLYKRTFLGVVVLLFLQQSSSSSSINRFIDSVNKTINAGRRRTLLLINAGRRRTLLLNVKPARMSVKTYYFYAYSSPYALRLLCFALFPRLSP